MGTTQAFIQGNSSGAFDTIVNAKNDIAVTAQADTRIIGVAAGVAAAVGKVGVGLAGSAVEIAISTSTLASIEGHVSVAAGGNVLVSAQDDTKTYAIGGAVGVGVGIKGGFAGAGAISLTFISKLTSARIAGGAVVDAYAQGGTISSPPAISPTQASRRRAYAAWQSRHRHRKPSSPLPAASAAAYSPASPEP